MKHGECGASIAKSGIEYMADFYDRYQELSAGAGVGFFQIGGGIAGDFPICVVPSIKYDLDKPVKPWAYFCQISDSTTSYGSYSGATPNEKITWDKLTEDTPMFVDRVRRHHRGAADAPRAARVQAEPRGRRCHDRPSPGRAGQGGRVHA